MNAIVDSLSDEEETGDVNAALRRLEGWINTAEVVVKQSKIDGWVRLIHGRLAAGDYGDEPALYPMSDPELETEDYGEARHSVASTGSRVDDMPRSSRYDSESSNASSVPIEISGSEMDFDISMLIEAGRDVITPAADKTTHLSRARRRSYRRRSTSDAKWSIEDFLPIPCRRRTSRSYWIIPRR